MTIGRNVDKIFLQNAIHVFQFRQENISKLRVRVWAQNNTLATVRVCSEKNYRVSPLSPEDITSENVLREKNPILVINERLCWESMCGHFTLRQSWKKTCGYRP